MLLLLSKSQFLGPKFLTLFPALLLPYNAWFILGIGKTSRKAIAAAAAAALSHKNYTRENVNFFLSPLKRTNYMKNLVKIMREMFVGEDGVIIYHV